MQESRVRARRIRSANRAREFHWHITSPPLLAFKLPLTRDQFPSLKLTLTSISIATGVPLSSVAPCLGCVPDPCSCEPQCLHAQTGPRPSPASSGGCLLRAPLPVSRSPTRQNRRFHQTPSPPPLP